MPSGESLGSTPRLVCTAEWCLCCVAWACGPPHTSARPGRQWYVPTPCGCCVQWAKERPKPHPLHTSASCPTFVCVCMCLCAAAPNLLAGLLLACAQLSPGVRACVWLVHCRALVCMCMCVCVRACVCVAAPNLLTGCCCCWADARTPEPWVQRGHHIQGRARDAPDTSSRRTCPLDPSACVLATVWEVLALAFCPIPSPWLDSLMVSACPYVPFLHRCACCTACTTGSTRHLRCQKSHRGCLGASWCTIPCDPCGGCPWRCVRVHARLLLYLSWRVGCAHRHLP
jgi:hypothetical protein